MNILNKLIEDLLERSAVEFSGALTIGLRNGGIKIKGEFPAKVLDTEKQNAVKTLATLVVPFEANIEINDVTFPVPTPK